LKKLENNKITKKDKNTKAKFNLRRIAIVAVIIIAIICILYVSILVNQEDNGTIYVEQGTIHKEETVLGYIIRNEQVIKNEEYQNGIIQIAGEGEKVYKDEAIFQYYSEETKNLSNQIIELDLKIQEQLKKEKINSSSDVKLIETQIEEKLEKLKDLNNTQEIAEYNKTIENLLEKKISTLGETNGATNDLKKLVKQRENINKQIRNSTKYLTAPISGIVSYKVDGLEESLTTNNLEKLTTDYLNAIDLKAGQIIATSAKAGKVIDNFSYYIATSMNSKEAINAKSGDKIKIRLSTNEEIQAQIEYINEEENGRVIILKIDRLTEKLTNYRKISFDVIWWSDSGLKVSNKAIGEDEKGLPYVLRIRSNYVTKIYVKILNKNENYSIVTTYDTEELTELGFTQEEISDYKKIKLYDEILLNPILRK